MPLTTQRECCCDVPQAYSYRDDPKVPHFDDGAPIAVMDASCALCNWGAQMIHRLDKTGRVRICPMQTPLGASLMTHYGLDPEDPESWLYLENGHAHKDFEAVIHAARSFGGWGRLVFPLCVLPKRARDWSYQRIARNRYRIFGQKDLCAVPTPAFQKRLMR
ncbi:MAG: DUF393 domain-containing protein [Pseudomonadota bacterium]